MKPQIRSLGTRAFRSGAKVVRGMRAFPGPSSSGPERSGSTGSRWLVVTVFCDPSDIDAGLPAPLTELGEAIEVRVRPAPGGKGTELAVRPRERTAPVTMTGRLTGTDPSAELRAALRRAKQLIEVGEVLAVDPAPHGARTRTPGGALVEAWTKAAPGAGVR